MIEKINLILPKYHITEDGRVFNKRTNKELKFAKDNKGYLRARLFTPTSNHPDGRKPFKLHRLVAMCYLDNYSEDLQVNHLDGDKTNNHYSNLEMVTNSENVKHAWNVLDSTERKNKLNKRRGEDGRFE